MKHLLFFLFLSLSGFLSAQDPVFSNPQNTPQLINPALTGAAACSRADAACRFQWPKLSGYYNTYNAAYEHAFRFGGTGFNFMHDNAGGLLFTTRADLSFSGYIPCRKDSTGKARLVIQPGIQIGFLQNHVDINKLIFGDMIDPRRGFIYPSVDQFTTDTRTNIDMSAGLLLFTKRMAAGFAVFHLTQPNVGFIGVSKLPMRFVVHASGIIGGKKDDLSNGFRIMPSVLVIKQQDFQQLRMMVNAAYNDYSIGFGYRNEDALIFQAGYRFKMFRFAYTYDMTISKLGDTGGAHELQLTAFFLCRKFQEKRTNLSAFSF